jgi:hypothetical protein
MAGFGKIPKYLDIFKNIFTEQKEAEKVRKCYENLYNKSKNKSKNKSNKKNKNEQIKHFTINLATLIELFYTNENTKMQGGAGGADPVPNADLECPICLEPVEPGNFICCPKVEQNPCQHGCCNLCWIKYWITKKFGDNRGVPFTCPSCREPLQLDGAKFNTIPDDFTEFMRQYYASIDNDDVAIDVADDRIQRVLSQVSFPENLYGAGDNIIPDSGLDNALRGLHRNRNVLNPPNIDRILDRTRNLIIITAITIVTHAIAHYGLTLNQNTFFCRPTFIQLLIAELRRESIPEGNPLLAVLFFLMTVGCYVVEGIIIIRIPSIFEDDVPRQRHIDRGVQRRMGRFHQLPPNVQAEHNAIMERILGHPPMNNDPPIDGGGKKRKRKTKKRKNKKTKSKTKTRSKKL